MSTLFPGAKDDNTTLPNPTAANNTNNPSHASQHANVNDAIKAVEGKVGTGATVPAASTLLIGTGAGTSAWSALTSAQLAAILSDETGTGLAVFGTTPTLVTPKIDTINEATGGNGTTVGGVNLKSGVLNTNNSVPTAAIQNAAVDYTKVATGIVVQVSGTNFGALVTNTALIPNDNTPPQITEGAELMTQAITPKSATNRLSIEFKALASSSVANHLIGALFQDATANALAATDTYQATATGNVIVNLTHDMVAGTTASTTFRVRLGQESAGTLTFNGQAGVGRFGGITVSSIRIIEYKA